MAAKSEKVSVKAGDRGCNCIMCGTKVKDKEPSLQCELCEGWCHAQCEKVSEDVLQVLQRENIHWYCMKCNKGIGTILCTIQKITQKQAQIDEEMKDNVKNISRLQTLIQDNSAKLSLLEADIQNIRKEKERHANEIKAAKDYMRQAIEDLETKHMEEWPTLAEQKLADLAAVHVDNKLSTFSTELQVVQKSISEAKHVVEEENDKENRRNNIILYNVAESAAGNVESKYKEDKEFFLKLMNALKTGVDEEDLKKMIRLGRKSDNGKPRPLLVQLGCRLAKNLIMDSLFRLKSIDAKFKGITVSHDMTKNEREECRKLVDEAKQKENQDASGEWIYRVRGLPGQMRIISIKKK
jgi:hypothetical protein